MTLLINGPTTGWLLGKLGMLRTDEATEALVHSVHNGLSIRCWQAFEAASKTLYGKKLRPELQDLVIERITVLQEHVQNAPKQQERRLKLLSKLKDAGHASSASKSVFFRILRSEYIKMTDVGIIEQDGPISTLLIESVDAISFSSNTTRKTFNSDFEFVDWQFEPRLRSTKFMRGLGRCLPESWGYRDATITNNWVWGNDRHISRIKTRTLMCLIQGHRYSQQQLLKLLATPGQHEEGDVRRAAQEAGVVVESKAVVSLAELELDRLGKGLVNLQKVEQVTHVVFEEQLDLIEKYVSSGLLVESQAHHLLEQLKHDKETAIQEDAETDLDDWADDANPRLTSARPTSAFGDRSAGGAQSTLPAGASSHGVTSRVSEVDHNFDVELSEKEQGGAGARGSVFSGP